MGGGPKLSILGTVNVIRTSSTSRDDEQGVCHTVQWRFGTSLPCKPSVEDITVDEIFLMPGTEGAVVRNSMLSTFVRKVEKANLDDLVFAAPPKSNGKLSATKA